MNFNLGAMPTNLHKDSIFVGINCTPQQFRMKDPSDRAVIMQNRKDRQTIVELAKNYLSHFSFYEFGEALQINLSKLEDDAAEILFGIFAHMAMPLSSALGYGDLRNEGTIHFFKEFSKLNFSEVDLQQMHVSNASAVNLMADKFQTETAAFLGELKPLIEKYDLSYEALANCFAMAFMATHRTIGQNFVRAMCRTAEVIGYNHQSKQLEINSPELLKVVTAISNTDQRYFPYV